MGGRVAFQAEAWCSCTAGHMSCFTGRSPNSAGTKHHRNVQDEAGLGAETDLVLWSSAVCHQKDP